MRAIGPAKIEVDIFRRRLVARWRHVEPLNGIGFVSGARFVEIIVRVGELRSEFADKLDANFIAARADGGAERGKNVDRSTAEFELHAANGFLSDARERAAPTSVNGGDDAFLWINEKNGHAIGSLHAEQQAGGVCERGVAFRRRGGGLREELNDVGVNLLQR